MLLIRTFTHALVGIAIVVIATTIAGRQNAPGLQLVLQFIGAGSGIPFGLAFAVGMNNYKALTIPLVLAILLFAYPATMGDAASILAPIGIGLALGSLCQGVLKNPGGTVARPEQPE